MICSAATGAPGRRLLHLTPAAATPRPQKPQDQAGVSICGLVPWAKPARWLGQRRIGQATDELPSANDLRQIGLRALIDFFIAMEIAIVISIADSQVKTTPSTCQRCD
jgi:hypothetical protein